MKKTIDPRMGMAVVAIAVVILVFFAYHFFASNPSSGTAVSPQSAGLGKPVYPSIPQASPGNASATGHK